MSKRSFSFTHNFHSPPHYYVNGVRYIEDYDLEEYEPAVRAFLTKRWTTKREVPPKVAILDDLGKEYSHVYYQQRLAPGDSLYTNTMMEKLYSTEQVNSQFMHALLCEDYEKSLIEEIMQKRVMNGSVPSQIDLPKQREIDDKTTALQKVFYDGEPLSDFEYDL